MIQGCCCCSVAKSCLTLCDPMVCIMSGFPVLHYLLEFAQFMSVELVMLSNHLILCHTLLLLPSIFPSIRIFSSESALHIKRPKYWSFCISPSNEHSGLISFRTKKQFRGKGNLLVKVRWPSSEREEFKMWPWKVDILGCESLRRDRLPWWLRQ